MMSEKICSFLPSLTSVITPALIISGCLLIFHILSSVFLPKRKKLPPGPPGLPLLGNVVNLLLTKRQHFEVINEWSEKYGPIFAFKMFDKMVYVLSDRALISEAFLQSEDMNGRPSIAIEDKIVGRKNSGIVLSSGRVWKEHRRFLMTWFRKMELSARLEEIVGSEAERFVNEVERRHEKSFDPVTSVNVTVANVTTHILTGMTFDFDDEHYQHVIECTGRLFHLMGPAAIFALFPIFTRIPSPLRTEATKMSIDLVDMIQKTIAARMAEFNPERPAQDFISLYLQEMHTRAETNNPGTFDDINLLISCVDTVLGGWEAPSIIITWVMFTLASHPDAQQRVRHEIFDVVGSDRRPRYTDRHSMPITEATLAECVRIRPVEPFHTLHVATRDCTLGGYDVPKGSALTTNLWYLARSPSLWEDPQAFRPGRFLDAAGKFNKKLEPLPFGYGKDLNMVVGFYTNWVVLHQVTQDFKNDFTNNWYQILHCPTRRRVCPGETMARMEIFIFITTLLQRFSLALPKGSPTSNFGKHGFSNRPDPFEIVAKKTQ